jgi:hypothetical protein
MSLSEELDNWLWTGEAWVHLDGWMDTLVLKILECGRQRVLMRHTCIAGKDGFSVQCHE